MSTEKIEETDMDIEASIRRSIRGIMGSLSDRNCSSERLAEARALMAKAELILKNDPEEKSPA